MRSRGAQEGKAGWSCGEEEGVLVQGKQKGCLGVDVTRMRAGKGAYVYCFSYTTNV